MTEKHRRVFAVLVTLAVMAITVTATRSVRAGGGNLSVNVSGAWTRLDDDDANLIYIGAVGMGRSAMDPFLYAARFRFDDRTPEAILDDSISSLYGRDPNADEPPQVLVWPEDQLCAGRKLLGQFTEGQNDVTAWRAFVGVGYADGMEHGVLIYVWASRAEWPTVANDLNKALLSLCWIE